MFYRRFTDFLQFFYKSLQNFTDADILQTFYRRVCKYFADARLFFADGSHFFADAGVRKKSAKYVCRLFADAPLKFYRRFTDATCCRRQAALQFGIYRQLICTRQPRMDSAGRSPSSQGSGRVTSHVRPREFQENNLRRAVENKCNNPKQSRSFRTMFDKIIKSRQHRCLSFLGSVMQLRNSMQTIPT